MKTSLSLSIFLGLLLSHSLLLPTAALALTVPGDVQKFKRRTESCDKLAENEPATEKEALELESKMQKQGCDNLEAEEKKLRWKYRNRLKILDAIEEVVKASNDVGSEVEGPAADTGPATGASSSGATPAGK